MSDSGIVNIHGREYHTVAKRLRAFWDKHPDWTITTKIKTAGEVVTARATIKDETGRIRATGTAEETRGSTNINQSSCVENAETSSIGRCLGVYGLGGTAIASAEEMEQALEAQKNQAVTERLLIHNEAVRDNIESILAIKLALSHDEYNSAYECFVELDEDTLNALRLAPTKGGIFTTAEIAQMKSNEWTEARHAHHGIEVGE